MGDKIYRYPLLVQWEHGLEKLKELKNKLQKYFQSQKQSNGGECEIPDTDCSRGYITIYFKEKGVPERVVEKNPHKVVLDTTTTLSLWVSLPDAENSQRMGNSLSLLAASSDDEASGYSGDTDPQHENYPNLDSRKRRVFLTTDPDPGNGDPKRSGDDSTGRKEWESGVDEKKHNVNSSSPKSLTEDYDYNSHEYSATPRDGSRKNSDDGAPGSLVDADYQQGNSWDTNNWERSPSLTDRGSIDGGPKRPDFDSTKQREWENTIDFGGTDGKGQDINSSEPKSLTEIDKSKSHEDSFTPGNESRRNLLGRPSSREEPGKNRPAVPPENVGASGSSADAAFFGTVTNPSLMVYEMKIGSVTYQVKTGDITKEKTEVIVNSSNRDFTRCRGVSKAILEAAGPSVVSSAKEQGFLPHNGYVITGPGNITHCKWILHLTVAKEPTSVQKSVLDILQECEKHQASSVTFPAVGTGAGRLAASEVADSILDGLVDFIKSKSVRSLQTVKVVLFQQPMLNDFYMSMKKREGTALPEDKSLITRFIDAESLTLLSHWKPMGGTLVMEVDVPPGTPEYSAVQQKFQKSCERTILKILRVQNRDLWLNYQIKKQNIDSKNGSTTNEKELFHGTTFNSIQHVNYNGFNRSYAGKHAASYGNGTYFAVNANYSASNRFSKPDGNGQKHMYLARVLTGLYCVGRHGMITPPEKNTAEAPDRYDSVADNLHNPSMFVIFNDIQAYPEYHIIFQ